MQEDRPLICVFCGSRPGGHPDYVADAEALGEGLARAGMGVVYGGASIGLMTAVADATLRAGGPVVGVVPGFLATVEIAHTGLTEQHIVETMHARKALMAERAAAFVALPGGYGTLDELCEILTWRQLRLHPKPIFLLNTRGYFDALLAMFDHMVAEGFLSTEHRALVQLCETPQALIARLADA